MSAFLTPLETEDVSDTSFVLLSPLVYQSDILGTITVPTGFVTDFNSTPRWPVIFFLVGGTANEASCLHDFLYKGSVSRSQADAVFAEAMEVTGQAKWRCFLMWLAVRAFGAKAYKR